MKIAIAIVIAGGMFLTSSLFAGEISGKVKSSKIRKLKNVLVYIEEIKGKSYPPPEINPKVDQKNITFVPFILPVLAGTTVEFHNSDTARHNVFCFGDYNFDLGTWGQGAIQKHTFNTLGQATLNCNIHAEMEAYILVLQNPYFSLMDEEGNYKIENVPSGTYKLKAWHNKLKQEDKEVIVPEQGSITVDFDLNK